MDPHHLQDKSKAFVTKQGTRLESVKDLYGHLAIITDEEFAHHVTIERNDFALWVENVHGDKFLAATMRRHTKKEELRKAIFIALF